MRGLRVLLCAVLVYARLDEALAGDDDTEPEDAVVMAQPRSARTPAQRLLDQLVATIGDVESFTRVVLETTGSTYVRYQGLRPTSRLATGTYTRTIALDLRTSSQRVDVVQTPLFQAFGAGATQPNEYTIVMEGVVGGATGDEPGLIASGTYPSVTVAALQRQQELFNPHILLRRAVKRPSMMSFGTTGGGLPILIMTQGKLQTRIFSDENGFITSLSVTENNPLTKDTTVFVKFMDWSIDASGVLFPEKVTMAGPDGIVLWIEERQSVEVDPILEPGYFDLLPGTNANSYSEASYRFGLQSHHHVSTLLEAGFHTAFDAVYAKPAAVIPGVYWLASDINSLLIHHDDGMILVEAGGSEVAATNLLKSVQAAGYAKTSTKDDDHDDSASSSTAITHVIQTHHHVDSAAGVREVLAQTGASLVVGFGIRQFWQRILMAKSTIRPDGLSKTKVTPVIRGIAKKHGSVKLINTMDLVVEVFHTSLDPDAADTLLVVVDNIVAGEIAVYFSDWYSAGLGGSLIPGGPEGLFDALREIGILNAECESSYPLTMVPSRGVPTTLEAAIAELSSVGFEIGCPA